MSDSAQKTKALLSQVEKNIIDNKVILLPQRPQKNSSADVSSNLLNGKFSRLKEILDVYSANPRPQSKPQSRSSSVQFKERVVESTPSPNTTPRIDDTKVTQNSSHTNQNRSNLFKNKTSRRHIDPHTAETKSILPEISSDKGNLIKTSQDLSGRTCSPIQLSKSPVGNTSSAKTVVQKEISRGLLPRQKNIAKNLMRESNHPSHSESNNNPRVETSRTPDPKTSTMKLDSAELVRKSLPVVHLNEIKDELRRNSSSRPRRPRIGGIRSVVSSAQPSARNRSGLAMPRQIDDVTFKNSKRKEGVTQNTSPYKKFIALMVSYYLTISLNYEI